MYPRADKVRVRMDVCVDFLPRDLLATYEVEANTPADPKIPCHEHMCLQERS